MMINNLIEPQINKAEQTIARNNNNTAAINKLSLQFNFFIINSFNYTSLTLYIILYTISHVFHVFIQYWCFRNKVVLILLIA